MASSKQSFEESLIAFRKKYIQSLVLPHLHSSTQMMPMYMRGLAVSHAAEQGSSILQFVLHILCGFLLIFSIEQLVKFTPWSFWLDFMLKMVAGKARCPFPFGLLKAQTSCNADFTHLGAYCFCRPSLLLPLLTTELTVKSLLPSIVQTPLVDLKLTACLIKRPKNFWNQSKPFGKMGKLIPSLKEKNNYIIQPRLLYFGNLLSPCGIKQNTSKVLQKLISFSLPGACQNLIQHV